MPRSRTIALVETETARILAQRLEPVHNRSDRAGHLAPSYSLRLLHGTRNYNTRSNRKNLTMNIRICLYSALMLGALVVLCIKGPLALILYTIFAFAVGIVFRDPSPPGDPA